LLLFSSRRPSLAAFRAFDCVVFLIWLRHARRELYMDHPRDVLVH
jgi:hypothetical protein